MTKTNVLSFVGTTHSGFFEQFVHYLDLTTSVLDVLFARALLHCDNKHLKKGS